MKKFLSGLEVKAQILSNGVKLSDEVINSFSETSEKKYLYKRRAYGNPDDKKYLTINIPQEIVILPERIIVNAILKEKSSWLLELKNNKFFLTHTDYEDVEIGFSRCPSFYGLKLKNGLPVESVLTYMFGHTIGIFANTSCLFAQRNETCKFCSIACNNARPEDLCSSVDKQIAEEAITIALKNTNVPIDNIFISGGNRNKDFDTNFMEYVELAKAVKSSVNKKDIAVTLNVYPPNNIGLLDELRNSGINLMLSTEVFDPEKFIKICPGKSKTLSKEKLLLVLKKSVEVLGHNRVFSFVIHGLEKEESLLKGIEEYAKMGVCTIVHVLRIEPLTPIDTCDGVFIPSPQQILKVTNNVALIYSKYKLNSSVAYGGRSSMDLEASILSQKEEYMYEK